MNKYTTWISSIRMHTFVYYKVDNFIIHTQTENWEKKQQQIHR